MKKSKLTAKRINEIFNAIGELFKGSHIVSLHAYRVGDKVQIDLRESFCKKPKDSRKEKRR